MCASVHFCVYMCVCVLVCVYVCMCVCVCVSVVAITGVSQSITIAIILVSKHYDYHYHYGSPLKYNQLPLQLHFYNCKYNITNYRFILGCLPKLLHPTKISYMW